MLNATEFFSFMGIFIFYVGYTVNATNGFYEGMDRQNLYKFIRVPTLAESLAKRLQNQKIEWQEKQKEYFWGERLQKNKVSLCETESNEKEDSAVNSRLERLKLWKAEKQKRLEEAKKNKKPAFKVGILQRKATGSPLLQKSYFPDKKLSKFKNKKMDEKPDCEKRQGMTTRSMANKDNSKNYLKPHMNEKRKETIKNKTKLNNKFCIFEDGVRKEIKSNTFKVPESVVMLPNIKLTIPSSPNVLKMSAKKVKIKNEKKSESIENENAKENKEFKSKISVFRNYVETERKRLLEACNKWGVYKELQEISEKIEGDIDSLIGRTKLLTSDKFKQFEDLIDKCEKGDTKIKTDDLQGFQDWVAIEIERCDEEFTKLEKLKCNNWVSESAEKKQLKKTKPQKNNQPKRPVGKSNIQAHIMAARKLLKGGQSLDLENQPLVSIVDVVKRTPKNNGVNFKNSSNSTNKIGLRSSERLLKFSNLNNSIESEEIKALSSAERFKTSENATPNRRILRKTENCFEQSIKDNVRTPRSALKSLENLTPGMMTRSRTKSTIMRDSPLFENCVN